MIHRRFAARLLNRPQLITPAAGAAVLDVVLPGASLVGFNGTPAADGRTDRDYQVAGTTAIIPVVGELVHRGGWFDALSGVCSYQALADMVGHALADSGVEGIILDLDTPGGEAAGCLDFAEWLAAQRGRKPIWAMVNQLACSAGYAIASASDRILIGRSAWAGSIGVVAYHADISKALAKAGVDVTYIFAGARKIDGAPELPLSPDALRVAQAAVNDEYTRFCGVVAANRGLSIDAVIATEAGIFRGQDAVSAGLADDIATPEEALAAMSTTTTVSAPSGARMQTQTPAEVPVEQPAPAAVVQPAPAQVAEQKPEAKAPEDTGPAAPQAVADACTKAGHPGLIAGFLQQGASMAAVTNRLTEAGHIAAAAKPLGLTGTGDKLIAAGVGLEAARGILFDLKASADGGIRTDPAHAVAATQPAPKLDHRAIFARQNGRKT